MARDEETAPTATKLLDVAESDYLATGEVRVDTTDDAWGGSIWSEKEKTAQGEKVHAALPDLRGAVRTPDADHEGSDTGRLVTVVLVSSGLTLAVLLFLSAVLGLW